VHFLIAEFAEWPLLASFASHGVLNKDPTVGLDGARPANKCIPPSFLGNLPMQMHCMPTPKSTLSSIKKLANFGKITFLHLKIGESVCQTHFGRQEIYIT